MTLTAENGKTVVKNAKPGLYQMTVQAVDGEGKQVTGSAIINVSENSAPSGGGNGCGGASQVAMLAAGLALIFVIKTRFGGNK